VADQLRGTYNVKVDLDFRAGNLLNLISECVERSDVCVVFLSVEYMEKVNNGDSQDWCRMEFCHAHQHSRLIPVVIDENLRNHWNWTGTVGIGLATHSLYVDFTVGQQNGIEELRNHIDAVLEGRQVFDELERERIIFRLPAGFNPLTVVQRTAVEYLDGTRGDEIEQIREWFFNDMERERVMVLLGPAGFAKSVLMSFVCYLGGMLNRRGSRDQNRARSGRMSFPLRHRRSVRSGEFLVGGAHFFRFDDLHAANFEVMILSIANQLAAIVPGLKEELENINQVELKEVFDLKTIFRRVIVEPCSRVSPAPPMLVILDGLDEAESERRPELLDIITFIWINEVPKWLGLLVAPRIDDPIARQTRRFNPRMFRIEGTNLDDVKRFVRVQCELYLRDPEDLDAVVEYFATRSKGLFIYASMVLKSFSRFEFRSLTRDQMMNDDDIVPPDLHHVFVGYFTRFLQGPLNDNHEDYQILFCSLVSAREGLDKETVGDLMRLPSERELNRFLRDAESLLKVDRDRVSLLHKSMVDFLLDKEGNLPTVGGTLVSGRRSVRIGSQLWVDFDDSVLVNVLLRQSSPSLHSAKHLLFYLCRSELWNEATDRLLDFGWLHSALSRDAAVVAAQIHVDMVQYYFCAEDRNKNAVDVVKILALGLDDIERNADLLGFHLKARLSDPDHPALRSMQESNFVPQIEPLLQTFLSPRSAPSFILRGHEKSVTSVAASGDWVVSGSDDCTLRVWNLRETPFDPAVLKGHTQWILSVAVDGERLVSGSGDGTALLWNLSNPEEPPQLLFSFQNHYPSFASERNYGVYVRSVAIEGDKVVAGLESGCVVRCTVGRHLGADEFESSHEHIVRHVAIQGDLVASGADDKLVKIHSFRTGRLLYDLQGHRSEVCNVTFVGQGKVGSCSDDKTVKVWDLNRQSLEKLEETFDEHDGYVNDLAFSNGRLASASDDERIVVMSLTGNGRSFSIEGYVGEVKCIALEGDRLVASGSIDNTVMVWDVRNIWSEGWVPKRHRGSVLCVALDKFRVVSGSKDGTLLVWDLRNIRNDPLVLSGLGGCVTRVAVSSTTVVAESSGEGLLVSDEVCKWSLPGSRPEIRFRSGTEEAVDLWHSIRVESDFIAAEEVFERLGLLAFNAKIKACRSNGVHVVVGCEDGRVHVLRRNLGT